MRISVKKLTASDLTFFEWQFRNRNAGNQKAINLNRNVFIDKLFPNLQEIADTLDGGKLPLELSIYGPGNAPKYALQRKIIKGGGYKNWRLNGEFVFNPEDDPERFNDLKPGDIGVFGFLGTAAPSSCRLFLISKDKDSQLHQAIETFMSNSAMRSAKRSDVQNILESASVHKTHPLGLIAVEDLVEEAALGFTESESTVWERRSQLTVSHEDMRKMRDRAQRIGLEGEEIVNVFLSEQLDKGEIDEVEWVASENAVSPYDFKIRIGSEHRKLDVKSTRGEFERPFHLSFNELNEVASSECRYDIYRIYEVGENSAMLRVAKFPKEFAEEILAKANQIPNGVNIQSFTVKPDLLEFDPGIEIEYKDD